MTTARATLAALSLLALTSCFDPIPPQGIACSPFGDCPDGQSCGSDGICRSQHEDKEDCIEGISCNTSDDPITDSSPFVGLVRQKEAGGRWLGTLIAQNLAITCRSCLNSLQASELEFRLGAVVSGVSEIRYPTNPEHDAVLLVLESAFSTNNLQLDTTGPAIGQNLIAIIPKSDEPDDASAYAVPSLAQSVSSTSFLFGSEDMSEPYSCTPGGPLVVHQNGSATLYGVHLTSPAPCGGGGYLAQRIDVLGDWIQEQIDDLTLESCDGFNPSTCGVDCGVQTCDDSTGEAIIGCEADPGECGSGKSCNVDANFTCQTDQLCTPSTKTSESNCGNCGDQYCNTAGNGYVCWEDSSECSSGWTCVSNGATWNCQSNQVCTPNTLQSQNGGCGDCGDLYCNASGTGTECRADASECAGNCYASGSQYLCENGCEVGLCTPTGDPCCNPAHSCYPIPGNEYQCMANPL